MGRDPTQGLVVKDVGLSVAFGLLSRNCTFRTGRSHRAVQRTQNLLTCEMGESPHVTAV